MFTDVGAFRDLVTAYKNNDKLRKIIISNKYIDDLLFYNKITLSKHITDDPKLSFRMYFNDSPHGLSIGTPISFHSKKYLCETIPLYNDNLVLIKKFGYDSVKEIDNIDELILEIQRYRNLIYNNKIDLCDMEKFSTADNII